MPNPFWNHQEHRLRFVWRIMLQVTLFLVGSGLASFAINSIIHMAMNNAAVSGSTQFQNEQYFQTIVAPIILCFAMVFTVWAVGHIFENRNFTNLGFHFNKAWWKDFAFGLGLGGGLILSIFLFELASGWLSVEGYLTRGISGLSFFDGIISSVVLFICVGIYEELWSRGYLLRNLAESLNFGKIGSQASVWIALILTSILFGWLHSANPNATSASTFMLVFAGLLLGLGYILTGELAIPIGFHITWNFFQGNIFGFPVSGTTPQASFIQINQSGPSAWTGGAFGPEAGLLGLFAYILGAVGIVIWVSLVHKKLSIQTSIAEFKLRRS